MEYTVTTPHGIFRVLQQLSYGEMIISGILTLILAVIGFKVLYDIADREGVINLFGVMVMIKFGTLYLHPK